MATATDPVLLAKLSKLRSYKPGKYGKGLIQSEAAPEAMVWRIKGGWNGSPHHVDVSKVLQVVRPNVAFHIDKDRQFYFHSEDPGFVHPKDPAKLAAHVHRQYPKLTWGRISAEEYEREHGLREGHKALAMNGRPLRDFERGAHLHVLDWSHETARHRFQAAGQVQVKAAAKAIVKAHTRAAKRGRTPGLAPAPALPALEAALHGELRKLYAVGHATVRSELDHQASGQPLPVGLSAETDVRTLAVADTPGASLLHRARLAAADVAHQIWQAVHRGHLQGIADPVALRQLGRDAGMTALRVAASHHAGGAIAAGRHAAATIHTQSGQTDVIGARYTSVLDKNRCGPCADADTGELIPLGDPRWIPTPNPACLGGDRCRCIHVYQLASERQPSAGQPDRISSIASPAYAKVGVGSS